MVSHSSQLTSQSLSAKKLISFTLESLTPRAALHQSLVMQLEELGLVYPGGLGDNEGKSKTVRFRKKRQKVDSPIVGMAATASAAQPGSFSLGPATSALSLGCSDGFGCGKGRIHPWERAPLFQHGVRCVREGRGSHRQFPEFPFIPSTGAGIFPAVSLLCSLEPVVSHRGNEPSPRGPCKPQ